MPFLLHFWNKELLSTKKKKKRERERKSKRKRLQKACFLKTVFAFCNTLPDKSHLLSSDKAEFCKHVKNHLPTLPCCTAQDHTQTRL